MTVVCGDSSRSLPPDPWHGWRKPRELGSRFWETTCLCTPHGGWQRPEQWDDGRVERAGGSLPPFLLGLPEPESV